MLDPQEACDDGPNNHPADGKAAGENRVEAIRLTGLLLTIDMEVDQGLRSPVTLIVIRAPCFGWLLYKGTQNQKEGRGHHWGCQEAPMVFCRKLPYMSDQLLALYLMLFEVRT